MEMSSAVYSEWRFTDQSLPNELAKRGMTSKQDPRTVGSSGVTSALHLHVEDYLYTMDGMDVRRTIEGRVRSYYAHFYHSDVTVAADAVAGVVGRRPPARPWRPLACLGVLATARHCGQSRRVAVHARLDRLSAFG
jgi:hypothetical protein